MLVFAAMLSALASAMDAETAKQRIDTAMWHGDFAAVERIYTANAKLVEPSGFPRLRWLRSGLNSVFDYSASSPLFHDQLVALTLRWTERHPESPLAHALHVRALVDRAWWFRGTEYSHKVPRDAMDEFTKTIDRARAHAARHGRVALLDSSTHHALLRVGMAQSWSADQLWAVAVAGLESNPEDVDLYLQLATALTPKWGGSARDLDRIVKLAVERTKATRGHQLYAWMYSRATAQDFGQRLFEDSHARWPLMKQGYEDWLVRHPSNNGVLNRFAYFACMARDQETALDLLDRIGDKVDLDDWGSNGARTLETCRRWAGRQ